MRKTIDAVPARGVLVALIAALLLIAGPAPAEAKGEPGSRAEAALIAPGAGYNDPHGSDRVRALQRRLRRAGERPGPVDGLFGPLTEAAVRRFQARQGLAVDGLVGRGHPRSARAATRRTGAGAAAGQRPAAREATGEAPAGGERRSLSQPGNPSPRRAGRRGRPPTWVARPPSSPAEGRRWPWRGRSRCSWRAPWH